MHENYDATISASGKTIVERDTYQLTFYPDGTSRITGSSVHIQGSGGIVVRAITRAESETPLFW